MQETPESRYERAKKRAKEIKEFYTHVASYVLVNAFLLVIYFSSSTGPGYFWVKWPLLGWGIALAIHAVSTFGIFNWWGPDWEERKIKELMEKEERKNAQP